MSWRLQKTTEELVSFYHEIFVENRPRYKDWREWGHLYVDFWVSLFSMSYTWGHVAALLVPVLVFIWLIPTRY